MTPRTSPPFRAEHVGSLLRPAALSEPARQATSAGLMRFPRVELLEAEDRAVRDVVRMQEDVGLQSITDGELRRHTWHMDFIYSARRRSLRVTEKQHQGRLPQRRRGDIEWVALGPARLRARHAEGADFRRTLPLPQSCVTTARRR